MYLYDTPRYTMAKDPMLQILCSTSTSNASQLMSNISNYIFMCSRALRSTQNISSIMFFRVHAQHKYFINHVLQGPCPTKNIYIPIYHQQLAYAQYTKQIIMFICSGVFDPKIKHQYNHHDQQAHAYKWQVQNLGHYKKLGKITPCCNWKRNQTFKQYQLSKDTFELFMNGIVIPPNQNLEQPNHFIQNPQTYSLNHENKIHLMHHLLH